MTTTKRRALSPILAVMLLLGLTVVGAGTAAVLFSDVSDNALSVSAVEINDARAYNTGDQAYISLGVKNTAPMQQDLKVSVLQRAAWPVQEPGVHFAGSQEHRHQCSRGPEGVGIA